MFIVLPSDPATIKAAEYLETQNIQHIVMDIPKELNYKTGANQGIYLTGDNTDQIMRDLSAQGHIIMRVFKSFEVC